MPITQWILDPRGDHLQGKNYVLSFSYRLHRFCGKQFKQMFRWEGPVALMKLGSVS